MQIVGDLIFEILPAGEVMKLRVSFTYGNDGMVTQATPEQIEQLLLYMKAAVTRFESTKT
jgi:hypothetical protein